MSTNTAKYLRLIAVMAAVVVLAFAAPRLIAGTGGGGCCPAMGAASAGSTKAPHAMLSGTVTAVGRDGSVTVKITPSGDAAKKALARVKVGDKLSLAMMLNKPAGTASAKYVCPMHPDVTSSKPAKCSKCGMNLEPARK